MPYHPLPVPIFMSNSYANNILCGNFSWCKFCKFYIIISDEEAHRIINDSEQLLISCSPAGSDVLKCPITCEVLKDPVVAAGKHQHCMIASCDKI